jgi:HD-GYP domain-containing protein (c-di-GMP phosphodiesterase class II)
LVSIVALNGKHCMNHNPEAHYIASVTAMGDTLTVLTNQAIFTQNGIKLVDQGARINSAFRERLVKHKLLTPIDQCLSVTGGVTPAGLSERAREMLDREPRFKMIRDDLVKHGKHKQLLAPLSAIPLTQALAFKLTVAREQRPELFEHSLQVALVALFLASGSHSANCDLVEVAAAAILHDIGILHIDPEILRPDRVLQEAEWRHVIAHPMTAFLILQEYLPQHAKVSNAVFQHHERLDGSGYPQGLGSEKIDPISKILMVADTFATVLDKSWSVKGTARLSMMLRMSRSKFSGELIDRLVVLLRDAGSETPDNLSTIPVEEVSANLQHLAEVLNFWDEACRNHLAAQPQAAAEPLLELVNERIKTLKHTLLEAGFHLESLAELIVHIHEDPLVLAEMHLVLCEAHWQVVEIVREVQRRRDYLAATAAGRECVENWIASIQALLQICSPPGGIRTGLDVAGTFG